MIHVPQLPIRPSPSRQGDSWMLTLFLVSESIPFAFGWSMLTNWFRSHVDFHLKLISQNTTIHHKKETMDSRTMVEDENSDRETIQSLTMEESKLYLRRETSSTSIIECDETTLMTSETASSISSQDTFKFPQEKKEESQDIHFETLVDTSDDCSHLSHESNGSCCIIGRDHFDHDTKMSEAEIHGKRNLVSWLSHRPFSPSLKRTFLRRHCARHATIDIKKMEHSHHVTNLFKALPPQPSSYSSVGKEKEEDTVMWA
jgi:hypothetical protein